MKYNVAIEYHSTETLIVEADNEEAAKRIAIGISTGPIENDVYDVRVSEYSGPNPADNDGSEAE